MMHIDSLDILPEIAGFWYLATPYSKFRDGLDSAYYCAKEASRNLQHYEIKHFCPIVSAHEICQTSGIGKLRHDFWMPVDQHFMDIAEGLLVVKLDGWDTSRGVSEEINIFASQGKQSYAIEPGNLSFSHREESLRACRGRSGDDSRRQAGKLSEHSGGMERHIDRIWGDNSATA